MPKNTGLKVTVSERALLQRINRKLKPEFEAVRKARRYEPSIGEYFRLDLDRNFVIDTHVDIESLAQELGVMGKWEQLEAQQ